MFGKMLSQAIGAYLSNLRLISFFSIPLIVAFPLALLLPNYVAASGIFLRLGSLGTDVGLPETLLMIAILIVSLLLFSFALVAVNSVIKAQRSRLQLKHTDFERMEEATFRLFTVLLIAFLATFAFNLLLYETGVVSERTRLALNALFAGIVSLLVLFAPQAIVIDNASPEHAFTLSASLLGRRLGSVVALIVFGAALVAVNTLVFTTLQPAFGLAPLAGIVLNALVLVPFLEVVKVQIYLSKYNLL